MPYQTTTLAQFIQMIGSLMGDPGNIYWPASEVAYAVWEGLRVWGSTTGYWRNRGSFTQNPNSQSPYYDLSVVLPALRSRSYPLWRLVQEIQYMLLEPPSPDGTISGSQMTQQITLDVILMAIQTSRNRFVVDARLPLTVHEDFGGGGPGNDLITYPGSTVYVHQLYWKDTFTGIWTTVQRDDSWGIDRQVPWWPLTPGTPNVYSESEVSPLTLQLVPPPANVGNLEAVTVDSIVLDTTNPNSTLQIPDEWTYAVKYAALSHIFSGESMLRDETRAAYAEKRYQQALEFASDFPYIQSVRASGIPLPMDALSQLEFCSPLWRNFTGYPENCATLYDLVMFNPGMSPQATGITADVISPAPLPQINDFIQLGEEDMCHLMEYVVHVLKFKCGGTEFTSSMSSYDSFMSAVQTRKAITQARIYYMEPLFGWYGREQALNPERNPDARPANTRPGS